MRQMSYAVCSAKVLDMRTLDVRIIFWYILHHIWDNTFKLNYIIHDTYKSYEL